MIQSGRSRPTVRSRPSVFDGEIPVAQGHQLHGRRSDALDGAPSIPPAPVTTDPQFTRFSPAQESRLKPRSALPVKRLRHARLRADAEPRVHSRSSRVSAREIHRRRRAVGLAQHPPSIPPAPVTRTRMFTLVSPAQESRLKPGSPAAQSGASPSSPLRIAEGGQGVRTDRAEPRVHSRSYRASALGRDTSSPPCGRPRSTTRSHQCGATVPLDRGGQPAVKSRRGAPERRADRPMSMA